MYIECHLVDVISGAFHAEARAATDEELNPRGRLHMACTGTWVGELRSDQGERYPLVLTLEQAGSAVSGTAGAGFGDLAHARVANGTHDAATGLLRLRLETIDDATERMQLEGTVSRDVIVGRFTYDDRGTGDVELKRHGGTTTPPHMM